MSNVVSLGCTCEYLLKRALRHRTAQRYDEAMTLLWKARNQFGMREDIELEMARIYDEIGREEEAARSYLRIVRMDGRHKAEALFHLALGSAQSGDLKRAVSYFDQFKPISNRSGIPDDLCVLLEQQLREDIHRRKRIAGKSAWARRLKQRSAECLREGKAAAAQRAMEHALRLRPAARDYTMLACCCLMRGRNSQAVSAAMTAHRLAPSMVQTTCVLSDAYAALGERRLSVKYLYIAAMRARSVDDLYAVAMESAKHGEDALTLRLTRRILSSEPWHTHGMVLRACALANLGRRKEAARLFGRLCGLLPENTVCESLFRMLRDGHEITERLSLGLDVTREEGINRASQLISMLYENPEAICADESRLQNVCRAAGWALHSPMAGAHTKTVTLILLGSLRADSARLVLLDALTDPQIADPLKLSILQILTGLEGFQPYFVDMDGRLVRLAAGGVIDQPSNDDASNAKVVQRVSDRVSEAYPEAPQKLLEAYLKYLNRYGHPDRRNEEACAAALEYLFLDEAGKPVDSAAIAREYGVTQRRMRVFIRRMQGMDE